MDVAIGEEGVFGHRGRGRLNVEILHKPVSPEELLSMAHRLIGPAEPALGV